MIESFVDLAYRGLPLGRRVKLAQVRPTSGYLEMPAPMPVGTTIAIATDEGLAIEARVIAVHEQVGGSTTAPGMDVAPDLSAPAAASWWEARVSLPADAAPSAVGAAAPASGEGVSTSAVAQAAAPPSGAAPQSADAPPRGDGAAAVPPAAIAAQADAPSSGDAGERADVEAAAEEPSAATERPAKRRKGKRAATAEPVETTEETPPVAADEPTDEAKRTVVMDAIDPTLLEQLRAESTRSSREMPAVAAPDGERTTIMAAVDLSALGLENSGPVSGEMPAVIVDEVSGEISDGTSTPTDDNNNKAGKRRRKKR